MTFKELAKKVAEYFNNIMEEDEFATFDDMKNCYWWGTDEIKDEIESVIKDYNWYFTDDRTEIYDGNFDGVDELYSYRKFRAEVFKYVK